MASHIIAQNKIILDIEIEVPLFYVKMDLHVHISGLDTLYSEEKYSDEN